MKMSKRVEVFIDLTAIIFGAFLCFLNFFKIVPGFGSTAALVATVIIAYGGPMGLIMVVLGVADLLKDRFFIAGPEDDDYYDEESEEDDYYDFDKLGFSAFIHILLEDDDTKDF